MQTTKNHSNPLLPYILSENSQLVKRLSVNDLRVPQAYYKDRTLIFAVLGYGFGHFLKVLVEIHEAN